MGEILLYNIPEGEKRRRITVALTRLGIRGRDVSAEEYGHPIGWLAGLEGFAPGEAEAEPVGAEMLVMAGLSGRQFSGFLEELRRQRAPVALKAVLTETNANWTPAALCRELMREHEAMRAARGPAH